MQCLLGSLQYTSNGIFKGGVEGEFLLTKFKLAVSKIQFLLLVEWYPLEKLALLFIILLFRLIFPLGANILESSARWNICVKTEGFSFDFEGFKFDWKML